MVDLAVTARASITRDGDWLEFGADDEGDPKWSDQATALYVAIAPFVRSGTVHIEGEDGARWSYTYADGHVTQQGWNGWDGSVEPFGEYVDIPPWTIRRRDQDHVLHACRRGLGTLPAEAERPVPVSAPLWAPAWHLHGQFGVVAGAASIGISMN
ncbi:hypothetical protein NKG94_45390 [Micromonospora sp. M12]